MASWREALGLGFFYRRRGYLLTVHFLLFFFVSMLLIPVVGASMAGPKNSIIDDKADSSLLLSKKKNAYWRERSAAQYLKDLFKKEIIDVISANINDLGPLSLDSLKKSNISASWTIMGNGTSDNMFSEVHVVQKDPDIEKEGQANEQDQLSGCGGESTCDSPEMQIRRLKREKRHEERAADLRNQNSTLEDAAILRSNSFNAAAEGHYEEIANQKADSVLSLMRDQIFMAKVYLTIAKMNNRTYLFGELMIRIEDSEHAYATCDAHSRQCASEIIRFRAMGDVLLQARQELYDCKFVNTKLLAMIQSVDDQVNWSKKQCMFQSQVAIKTIPDGMHCLGMQLTKDYYLLSEEERKFSEILNLVNPDLYHYALFSDNVLAASVAVNSLIMNAKEPEKHVFHLATDEVNFGAMNMWFLNNPPGKATIQVENFDSFKWLNSSYCPVLRQQESAVMKEYYYKEDHPTTLESGQSNFNYRNPKYLSMLNHLRFYLPQIYPELDKILFLDDDVVVQKDLTPLWSVDLHGKVNGAVETCGKNFHRFNAYLNFSDPRIAQNFDPQGCGWAYGMNLFDLKEWRKRDITAIYHKWQSMNENRTLWQLGSLPPGLLTFYGLTHALDKSWHVLALGYNPNVDESAIQNAAVIHFNGNRKPWLETAISKYQGYWTQYLKLDDPNLHNCMLTE